jgi:RND family efflux transporter MFP subunit
VERAKAAADLAAAVVRKLEPLNQRHEISDQQLLEAKRKLDDVELAAKTAQARLELVLAGARPEAIAEAEAKVTRAAAAVAQAGTRLDYSTLTSPRRGTVDAIHCHPGQVLAPGTAAVEVIDTSSLIANVSVPVAEAAKLKPGQPARVMAAWPAEGGDAPASAVPGKVASVGLQTSAATGALPVRVLVANAGGALRAGMVVRVEITVGEAANVLAVPEAAILAGDEGPAIAVVRSGKVGRLHPRLGLRQRGLIQAEAEGLAAGDLVVTRCAHDLADGAAVKIKEGHEEPAHPEAAPGHEEPKR